MVDRHGQGLTVSTPAMLGTADVHEFHGQSLPGVSVRSLGQSDIDTPLLDALLACWKRRYTFSRPEWKDIALFRSLNMANQASRIPAGSEMTLYDAGRSVAIWVSAFEILAHPGTGRSKLTTVYDLLDRAAWRHQGCRTRRFKAYERGKKFTSRRRLGCRLYGELYQVRNDFLHGNPVQGENLIVKGTEHSLFQYAASLYRMALASLLALEFNDPVPPLDDTDAFGRYSARRGNFSHYQDAIEDSLLTARRKSTSRQSGPTRKR